MAYFVVTNKNNVNKFYLTSTCNKPRIAVKQGTKTSYMPMRTALTTVTSREQAYMDYFQYENDTYEEHPTYDLEKDYTGTSCSRGFTAVRFFPIEFDFRYGFKDIDKTEIMQTIKYSQSGIVDSDYSNKLFNSIGVRISNNYICDDFEDANYRANLFNIYYNNAFHRKEESSYTKKYSEAYFNLTSNTDYKISFSEYETYQTSMRTNFCGTWNSVIWSLPQCLQAGVYTNKRISSFTDFVYLNRTRTITITRFTSEMMYRTHPQLLGIQSYIYKRVYKANKKNPIELVSGKATITRIAPGYEDGHYNGSFYAGRFIENSDGFYDNFGEDCENLEFIKTITVQTWL